jgi:hypothetical protein
MAHARGAAAGYAYGTRLLTPGRAGPRPRCPHWCPARAVAWCVGYAYGLHEALNLR